MTGTGALSKLDELGFCLLVKKYFQYSETYEWCLPVKVMKALPNTCHNFRTEGFQIPIKLFLIGNSAITLHGKLYFVLV